MRNWLRKALYLAVALGVSGAKAGAYDDFFRAVNVDNALTVGELLQRGFDLAR